MTTSLRPMTAVSAPDEGQPRIRQLLVPIGQWSHPDYGTLVFTAADIQHLADQFSAGAHLLDGGRLPISSVQHDDKLGGAAGWIYAAEPTPEGLVVELELTRTGRDLVGHDERPYISPDLLRRPTRTAAGTAALTGEALTGASLVVRPFFTELPRVQMDGGQMAAHDPISKSLMIFCAPEDAMPDEQVTQTPPAAEPETETPDEQPAAEQTEAQTPPPAYEREAEMAFAAAQEKMLRLEGEVSELKRERRLMTFGSALEAMTFGDESQPMRMAPGARGTLAEVLADLEPDKADAVIKAVGEMVFYDPGVQGLEPAERTEPEKTAEDLAVEAQFTVLREEG